MNKNTNSNNASRIASASLLNNRNQVNFATSTATTTAAAATISINARKKLTTLNQQQFEQQSRRKTKFPNSASNIHYRSNFGQKIMETSSESFNTSEYSTKQAI